MNIIIAGAGSVGYLLSQSLSIGHNVIVIDQDVKKLERLDDEIDIYVVRGDVEDPKSYQALPVQKADLFIAVTDSDEANLLATLIVEDVVDVGKKIVRLKNDAFVKSHVLQKLSVDYAIFPDILTARRIKSILAFPKANNVKAFHQTKHKLISIKIELKQSKKFQISQLISDDVKVIGVERDKKLFVPTLDEVVSNGDLIYLYGNVSKINELASKLDEVTPDSIKRVVIFGANIQAQKIANALLSKDVEIKMIEKDSTLCKEASAELGEGVMVINSAYEDHKLFEEEGIKYADMVIAAGHNDEKNIVKCVEAKEYGISKVIAINNDKSYYSLMHKLGLVVVRGSKASATFEILEKISSSSIVTQRHYCGGEGVLFMRKIYPNSPLIDKKINKHTINKHTIKNSGVVISREERLYDITQIDRLQKDDVIVLFGNAKNKEEMQKWIYSL
jgi:trk system potassium uptake protein TrkA